ncbi:hypothetical protein M9Y10_025387 [Tritrichomonas musculus]|uniref:CKK domain-containing protein n=1 Tax=Tritrichomonas musculus TaxID=1915356 RepID=A0ABR2HB97_9EUKA
MENNQMLKPTLPKEKRTSPRSQMLASASSKRSPRVPALPSSPSALDDKTPDKNDPLVPSPLQYNRRSGLSARGQPSIVRPKFDSNSPSTSRNQKKPRDKASARTPRCESILDVKTHPRCQKYVSDIERIERIKKKLTTRHAENERYYNSHYTSFLRILKEAINENPAKIPIVVQNTKMFFEGLLQNLIGKRGKLDKANFDFEGTLRSILSSADSTINDQNGFKELFENGKLSIDLSKLKQYESEIEEIKGLMQKLVDRHPENERYYRKHYESFLRILSEAVSSNSQKAPTVIRNTKMFFEGLLNGLLGKNGRLKTKSFNFEEKLRKVISNEDDDTNDDIIQELIDEEAKNKDNDEDEQDKLQKFMSNVKEINNIVQQLIDKYPENEDYYRDLYDSFMKVLNEAIKTDDEKAPSIIQNARTFFEGLLNDQIGENGKVDDPEFNFEERLRKILSKEDDDDDEDEDDDENVFEDLINKKEKEKLQKYEAELKKINDLVEQLIDKHPENEDYYRDLYDSFMKVLKEAINTDDEKTPSIIQNARTFFEGLLNDQIGENGKVDDPEFNFEERLRKLLSQENNEEEDDNENVFKDLLNKKEQEKLQKYETEIKEINDLVQQLVDKYPENEDYYRDLYDSFMKVLNEAIKTDDEKAPSIIQNARTFFEGLLNDQIGENGKVDDPEFNFEERLRKLLSQENNEEDDNENVFEDLINKKEQEKLQKYETELKEIDNLVQQLVDKHPENEDYYRDLYDSFMKILKEAINTDDEKAPSIIQNARTFFEGLLNDQIGENGKVDDPEFNFEERLRKLLSQENNEEEDDNENVFKDLLNKKEQEKLQKYENEINQINDLVQQLVDKHPENEDYYRDLYDSFMKILKEAINTDDEKAPSIIQNARTFFEGLLNDQIGENGKVDDSEFNFEERLRKLLSQENNEEEENENVFEDLLNKKEQEKLQKYETELKEINDLVQQLVDKHPENEDYYRDLYDSFMKILKEAIKTDDEKAPSIIQNARTFFEGLLSDQIGENGKVDDSEFNFEERLRKLLSQENNEEEDDNENVFKDLLNKKEQEKLQKYENEINQINDLVQQLVDKHPENEDYYRDLYDSFMKILKEAINTDDEKAPSIIQNARTFFEGLLNDQIGENGKVDDPEFNFEERLRKLLSQENNEEEDDNENVFEDLLNKKEQTNLQKYEAELKEINDLLQQLIDKNPENEDYYRKRYDAFMRVLSIADSEEAPKIIKETKEIFQDLLKDEESEKEHKQQDATSQVLEEEEEDIGGPDLNFTSSGRYNLPALAEDPEYDDDEEKKNKSQSILQTVDNENGSADDDSQGGTTADKKDDESNQSVLDKYQSEIGEIKNLMNDLIEKHPENEDYYRKLYDAFMRVIKEASEADSPAAPEIIEATKSIFEDLLNGEQDRLDYDLEDRLREILSKSNERENKDETNENVEEKDDSENNNNDNNEDSEENDQSSLKKYESEIGKIKNLMNDLIEKHPENEDYYKKLYEAFMKVIKEASEADSPAAPEIIEATKSIFEDLLNGEQGRLDYELEDKLREILSKSNEIENENEPLDANKTESAIDEITSLLHRLIEKHPENEEFYQKLYDSFIVIIRQASEANSPQVSGIIRATKLFFEELLNGEHAKIDFNIGEKLREILLSVNNIPNENKNESENNENNENENNENEIDNLDENVDLSNYEGEIGEIENLMQDLIDKHPENEDYYRKLYEAFMKVVKEAAEANSPAAVEIIKAAKKIFADLYNGEQDHLDFDMEDKLREILSIYKPYNEVDDEDEDMKMSQTSSSRNPRFEKLYPPPQVTSDNKHRTSTVPNYQTILCALRFSCLPGPRFTKLVESIATTMKENKDERYVLLMASRTHKFKGIYILSDDELSAKKMWGEGPKQIKSEDCGAFSKYITNQKIFEPLQIKSFTQTTDAFSLKKNAEPDLW